MNFLDNKAGAPLAAVLVGLLYLTGNALGVFMYDTIVKAVGEIEEIQQSYVANKLINDQKTNAWAETVGDMDMNLVDLEKDFLHYTENYAWSLAKYEIVKAIVQGQNLTVAENNAHSALKKYYGNITKAVLERERYVLTVFKWLRDFSINPVTDYDGIQNVQFITTKFTTDDKARYYRFVNTTVNIADQTFNRSVLYVGWFNGSSITASLGAQGMVGGDIPFKVNGITVATFSCSYSSCSSGTKTFAVDFGVNCVNVTLTFGSSSKQITLPEPTSGIGGKIQYTCSVVNPNTGLVECNAAVTLYGSDYVIKVVTVDSEPLNYTGRVVWEKSRYDDLLSQIDSTYDRMRDNLHAYVVDVSAEYVSGHINLTDILDPYVIASQIAKDAKNTQYYAYAAAELALLGIPTNITSTWVIKLDDNTTLEGILLADYVGKVKVGEKYNFPFAYLLTDNGLYSLCNVNFTVVGIKDYTGRELNETELVNYNMQGHNATKIKEDLEQLEKLWEDYNKIQSQAGEAGILRSGGLGWMCTPRQALL